MYYGSSTKVFTHRRYTRPPLRGVTRQHKTVFHWMASLRISTQLQQARHSGWRDNHLLTTTPTSQGAELAEAGTPHLLNSRTLTKTTAKTTNKNRKRKRARPA